MKLDYIGIRYEHNGDEDYIPYIELTYRGALGNCYARIFSPRLVTGEFVDKNQNNFGMPIKTDKDLEVIVERLKQLNITSIDQMAEVMLEMIQLTSKGAYCMELLP